MHGKQLLLAVLLLQVAVGVLGQKNWLPETVSAYEMWSPATWYYPYGIAASESWTEYLKNAQQATNQLYQMFEKTGAANLYNPGVPVEDIPGRGKQNLTGV